MHQVDRFLLRATIHNDIQVDFMYEFFAYIPIIWKWMAILLLELVCFAHTTYPSPLIIGSYLVTPLDRINCHKFMLVVFFSLVDEHDQIYHILVLCSHRNVAVGSPPLWMSFTFTISPFVWSSSSPMTMTTIWVCVENFLSMIVFFVLTLWFFSSISIN